jgi:Ca-activated chloride channel family protein
MTPGINLQQTLSRTMLAVGDEPQLVYVLLEAHAEGVAQQLPKLPLNLCLVLDRSSSMRGERLMQVKEAAARIVDQLGPDDYFSLVVFNDRADVVIPAQRAIKKSDLKAAIAQIEAAGGTEMAQGLALALQEVQRPFLTRGISRLILLTDGRTYGDESRCVEIARRGQSRGIGLTALGIGTEWNEDLLETMTASENSRAQYIATAQDVVKVFADEVKRLHAIFAQQVHLSLETRPGALIRSLDQVRPFIAPITIVEEQERCWAANLGDWPDNGVQGFLIEVVVPALPVGDHPVLKLTLRYHLPAANLRDQVREELIRISMRPAAEVTHRVDATVKHWLERLVAYRLQASAWQHAAEGRLAEASERLHMAGTRMLNVGDTALAHTLQQEATRILRSGAASEEGRKRIRFGTRGLIGPVASDERETGT